MSSTPQRTSMSSSSPPSTQSPRRTSGAGTHTLPRSRSSTLKKKKDLSRDEGTALNDMHRKADKQFEDERRREAEAKSLYEQRMKEQQEKFSDEESDSGISKTKYKNSDDISPGLAGRKAHRPSESERGATSSPSLSNGLEAIKLWQDKYHDVDSKYKDSMLANAQLYNEKAALVYQVEVLKDRLEDLRQDLMEVTADLQREQSTVHHQRHHNEAKLSEIESLKKQIDYRDQFIEKAGLHLPTDEEDEEEQLRKRPELDPEEREELQKEIQQLKDEIASMKSGSVLGDQQPKDIVQVSTRMVSEYKTKLQISEAERSRLEGMTTRLTGQVTRYKTQVKELEEREDDLMKEKRKQAKEIRSLQSDNEDQKTEIDLLKRRIEALRKRKDYSLDS